MVEKTIDDLLRAYGCTLTDLAAETGLSISLLSKIRHRAENITKNTQSIFEEKYGIKLVNGSIKWKDIAEEREREISRLKNIHLELVKENNMLRRRLEAINNISDLTEEFKD